MSGYIGTKSVTLSTTAATVGGDSTIGGDLTVDTNTLYVDSASNNVGIGTTSLNKSSSSTALTVNTGTAANYSALELSSGDTLNWHINANNGNVYDVTAGSRNRIFYTGGSERLRILSSGGITFNGDTAAANALDDYEEGTYDVTFSGDSGTPFTKTSAGKYLKIGRLVFINFYAFTGSSPTVPSGTCYASLPFTADTSPLLYSHIMQGYAGGLSLNTVPNVSNGRRWQINNSSQLTSYTGNWASSPSYYELSGAGCYIAAS